MTDLNDETRELDDPFAGCFAYDERGACHCSTGVGGVCGKPLTEPRGDETRAAPPLHTREVAR